MHIGSRRFESDENSNTGTLTLNGASQISNMFTSYFATFYLDKDIFDGFLFVADESNCSINTFVLALLSYLTFTVKRLCSHQRERPLLELISIFAGKLTGRTNIGWFTSDPIILAC